MRKFLDAISRWIRKDGELHIAFSFLITLAVAMLAQCWWIGVIFGVICGIMKEVMGIVVCLVEHRKIDWRDIGHDLICDTIGIALGVAVWFIYYSIISQK